MTHTMHHIIRLTPQLIARSRVDERLYTQSLSSSQLAARYILRQHTGGVLALQQQSSGAPVPQHDVHWSTSYSADIIALCTSDRRVGIDIEHIRPRHNSLWQRFTMQEQALARRDWTNFYKMWTAKEALIKRLQGSLDDIYSMTVRAIGERQIDVQYQGRTYHIPTIVQCNYCFSITS